MVVNCFWYATKCKVWCAKEFGLQYIPQPFLKLITKKMHSSKYSGATTLCNTIFQTLLKLGLHLHVIEDAENDTKHHLPYPQNDRHLHLVGVGEEQLVLSHIPDLQDGN